MFIKYISSRLLYVHMVYENKYKVYNECLYIYICTYIYMFIYTGREREIAR